MSPYILASGSGLSLGLDEGLHFVTAIDFDVDFGIVFFLFPLLVEVFAEIQQVEGQKETKHAEGEETHIHLEERHRNRGEKEGVLLQLELQCEYEVINFRDLRSQHSTGYRVLILLCLTVRFILMCLVIPRVDSLPVAPSWP